MPMNDISHKELVLAPRAVKVPIATELTVNRFGWDGVLHVHLQTIVSPNPDPSCIP